MNDQADRSQVPRFDEWRWWQLTRCAGAALVSLSVLAALAAALITSNQRVPGPSGWTYAEVEAWVDRQPVSAAFSLVSAVALVVVLYLMVSTVALLAARAARAARLPRVERMAASLAVPVIRRSLAAVMGLGLTVTAHSTPVLGASVPATPSVSVVTEPPGIATMRSVEPPVRTSSPSQPTPEVWTIQPGDHLWGLAESTLSSTWAQDPSDGQVAAYLEAIVELNRDILVVPGHPDLVFPGQVFERPSVPEP